MGHQKKLLVLLTLCLTVLGGCKNQPLVKESALADTLQNPVFSEYCFSTNSKESIGMSEATLTPAGFIYQHDDVLSAINGPYFSADKDRTMGIAYLADGHHYGDKRGRITGYFTVNRAGTEVAVSDKFSGDYKPYWMVIGTFPILVQNSLIHAQAKESRYNVITSGPELIEKTAYRSAIGTKDGKNICFAVSESSVSMSGWAEILSLNGYKDALNLDGGPISQLAIKDKGVFGGGIAATRLIIYSNRH